MVMPNKKILFVCFVCLSTQRWKVLFKNVPIVVKRVIDTRLSAHYEAVKTLQYYFLDSDCIKRAI